METKIFREHNEDNSRTLFLPRSYRKLREEYRKASNHRYLQRENRYFSGNSNIEHLVSIDIGSALWFCWIHDALFPPLSMIYLCESKLYNFPKL